MKHFTISLSLFVFTVVLVNAQAPDHIVSIFPKGTIFHQNVPYANDTVKKHLLDIYLPANASAATPLIIWVHGGAWNHNDKYADMGYMKSTIKALVEKGYALASIDYRQSSTAIFPAQIQDCIQAVEFLNTHAEKYKLDKNKFVLMGFSAGGHLASLVGLSNNQAVTTFYHNAQKPHFKIKCVLDFYGPSDFITLGSSPDTSINNERNAVSILLGSMPIKRPDLARQASPSTYVDKNDPPFFIVQGEKDESVPYTQSQMLAAWLTVNGVPNQLTIVPGAPHYGVMFDAADIRKNLFAFLAAHL